MLHCTYLSPYLFFRPARSLVNLPFAFFKMLSMSFSFDGFATVEGNMRERKFMLSEDTRNRKDESKKKTTYIKRYISILQLTFITSYQFLPQDALLCCAWIHEIINLYACGQYSRYYEQCQKSQGHPINAT